VNERAPSADEPNPLIPLELERLRAAGEKHRQRREADLEALRQLHERNPDAPEFSDADRFEPPLEAEQLRDRDERNIALDLANALEDTKR